MTSVLFRSHRAGVVRRARWCILAAIAFCSVFAAADSCDADIFNRYRYGRVELDVTSDYSHIRVRRKNSIRTLIFVRDSGEEALETQMDLDQPHELHFDYLRHMFLSYVFRARHERVLIVGLGGGSMVHFLKQHDPDVIVDAVEIDPVVVRIADEYFGTRSERNVNIVTADAFEFLRNGQSRYDVIYMDAFLKPSDDTDSTGVPLRLRTLRFYEDVQNRLAEGGLVLFNVNPHADMWNDVKTIREAFPQVYVFSMPGSRGLVVAASMQRQRLPAAAIARQADELDRRFDTSFSFRQLTRNLVR